MQKAMEFDDRIPIGLLYREDKATYHQKNAVLSQGIPLLDRKTDPNFMNQLIKSYI
jgi:2-oxoglutarate ferredoxin oxidoreductase subunit beta